MIHDATQFESNGIKIEVNWNKDVTPCKKIKFTIDGKEAIMDREDFYATLMLFGDDKQQESLIPVVETKVRQIRRLLKIRAKKDMKKGDIIAFPYDYYVPAAVYEKLLINPDYSAVDLSTAPDLAAIVNKKR